MPNPLNIFHTKIDRISKQEALRRMFTELHTEGLFTVVTPNPEILLKAKNDQSFRQAINNASLRIPDGFGLMVAGSLLNTPIKERLTGVDILTEVLQHAEQHHHSVYVVLQDGGLSSAVSVRNYLEKKYPELQVHAQQVSTHYRQSGHLIDDITSVNTDIVIVTFGAPTQELWLEKNKSKLKKVHLALAVGGSFDMLTGKVKRAPSFLRKVGLEWLWRLLVQPENKLHRAKRIFDAVVIFSINILYLKYRSKFVFRKNALMFVYKNKEKILILHKRSYGDDIIKRKGHWALPQGGAEVGEPLHHTAQRELKEETGILSIQDPVRASATNKYRWAPYYKNIYSHRFAGQTQKAYFIKFNGDEDEIRLNFIGDEHFDDYRWVNQKQLISLLEPARRPFAKRLLLEFNRKKLYTK